MLVEEGYDVVGEAGDGETAVRLAEELKPDLVHPRHQDADHGWAGRGGEDRRRPDRARW